MTKGRVHEPEHVIEPGAGKQPEEHWIGNPQRQGRDMNVWRKRLEAWERADDVGGYVEREPLRNPSDRAAHGAAPHQQHAIKVMTIPATLRVPSTSFINHRLRRSGAAVAVRVLPRPESAAGP
jgi:hypothetical protein